MRCALKAVVLLYSEISLMTMYVSCPISDAWASGRPFDRGKYSGNSAYNHRGTVSDFGEAGEEFLGFIGKN